MFSHKSAQSTESNGDITKSKLRRVCKLLILKGGIFSGSLKSAQGIENKEVNSECGVGAGGSKGKMVSHLTPEVIHIGSIL